MPEFKLPPALAQLAPDLLADPSSWMRDCLRTVSPGIYETWRRAGLVTAYVGPVVEGIGDIAHWKAHGWYNRHFPDPGRRFELGRFHVAGGMDPTPPIEVPSIRLRDATPDALVRARLLENAAVSVDEEVWQREAERIRERLAPQFQYAPNAQSGAEALFQGLITLNQEASQALAAGMAREKPPPWTGLYRDLRQYERAWVAAAQKHTFAPESVEYILVERDCTAFLEPTGEKGEALLKAETVLDQAQRQSSPHPDPLPQGEREIGGAIEQAEARYFEALNTYIAENGLGLSPLVFSDIDRISLLLDSKLLGKIEAVDTNYFRQRPEWTELKTHLQELEDYATSFTTANPKHPLEKEEIDPKTGIKSDFPEMRKRYQADLQTFLNSARNTRHLIAGLARVDAASQAMMAERERVVALLRKTHPSVPERDLKPSRHSLWSNTLSPAQALIQAQDHYEACRREMQQAEAAYLSLHNTRWSEISRLRAAERARKARHAFAVAEAELTAAHLRWVDTEGVKLRGKFYDALAITNVGSRHEFIDFDELALARREYFKSRSTVESVLAENERTTRPLYHELQHDYDRRHRELRYKDMRLQLDKAREEFAKAQMQVEASGNRFAKRAIAVLRVKFDRLVIAGVDENQLKDVKVELARWKPWWKKPTVPLSIEAAIKQYEALDEAYLKQYAVDLNNPAASLPKDAKRDVVKPNRAQETIVTALFDLSRLSEGALALAFGEKDVPHQRFSVFYPAVASNFTRRSWFEHRENGRALEWVLGKLFLAQFYMWADPYSTGPHAYDPRRTDPGLANVSTLVEHHAWTTLHRAPWYLAALERLHPRFIGAAQHNTWFSDFPLTFAGEHIATQWYRHLDPRTVLNTLYGYGMPSGKEGLSKNDGARAIGVAPGIDLWMNPAVNSRNPQVAELQSVLYNRSGYSFGGRARAPHSTHTYYPLTMEVSNLLSLLSGLPGELVVAMSGPFTNFINGGNSREMRLARGAEARSGRRDTNMRLAVQMGGHSIFPKPDKKIYCSLVEMTEAIEIALPAALEQVYTREGRRIPQIVRDIASTIALRTAQLKSTLSAEVPLEMVRNGVTVGDLELNLLGEQSQARLGNETEGLKELRRGRLPQEVTLEAFRQMARITLSEVHPGNRNLLGNAIDLAATQLGMSDRSWLDMRAEAEIRRLVIADRREFEIEREHRTSLEAPDAMRVIEIAEFLRSDAMSVAFVNSVVAFTPHRSQALYNALVSPTGEAASDAERTYIAEVIHVETQRRAFNDAVRERFRTQSALRAHWHEYRMDGLLRRRLAHLPVALYQEGQGVIATREAVLAELTQDGRVSRPDVKLDWLDATIATERELQVIHQNANHIFSGVDDCDVEAERMLTERFHALERAKKFYVTHNPIRQLHALLCPRESILTRIEAAQQALVAAFDVDMDRRENEFRRHIQSQVFSVARAAQSGDLRLKRAHEILHPELLQFGVVAQLAGHFRAEAVSSHLGMGLYMVGEGAWTSYQTYQNTGRFSLETFGAGLWQSLTGVGLFMGLDKWVFAPLVKEAGRFLRPFASPEAVFQQGPLSRVMGGVVRGAFPAGLASMAIFAGTQGLAWLSEDHRREGWDIKVHRLTNFGLGMAREFLAGGPAFAIGSLIGSNLGRALVLAVATRNPGRFALCAASAVASMSGLFVGSQAAHGTRFLFNGAFRLSGDLEYKLLQKAGKVF